MQNSNFRFNGYFVFTISLLALTTSGLIPFKNDNKTYCISMDAVSLVQLGISCNTLEEKRIKMV